MKILVTGPHGMLGTDLMNLLREKVSSSEKGLEIIEAPHEKLDITNEEEVTDIILKHTPDVIVNCAAYTNVDGCESERELAYNVNALGPKYIAKAAAKCNAKLVQISTDFVYDGELDRSYVEADTTNPLSEYGRSKLEGEKNIQNNCNSYLIVRTSWLFGHRRTNFIEKMLELAKKRNELSIVDDEVGSPTFTADLAKALWILIEKECEGIFHVANQGSCSRYEWAKEIFSMRDYDIKVHPIDSSQFKRVAKVPKNSILNCQKLTTATGFQMRPWEDTLKEYLLLSEKS